MTDDLPAQLVTAATEAINERHPLTHSDRLQARAERQGHETDARAAVVATLRAMHENGLVLKQPDHVGIWMDILADRIEQGDEEN
jgi:hypothetical protein